MTGCDSGCDSGGLEVTHFRLDVTITSITSITSGFWPDVTLDGSLPGASPKVDAYHWSAMEFGEHWLQRLSLVLARGQGDLVLEAVKTARKNHRGRDGGRGASAEWSQTDCQPCVSLV